MSMVPGATAAFVVLPASPSAGMERGLKEIYGDYRGTELCCVT
jgi:hypothetical protein